MLIEMVSTTQTDPTCLGSDEELPLVLEKTVALVERLWREEVGANRIEDADTPRQAALRKAHQALGEWFELETLSGQDCPSVAE